MANTQNHIYIYGDIFSGMDDWGGVVSLNSVKNEVEKMPNATELVIHIHSNGGQVYEGFAIHDYLVNTGKKITTIAEGICASIATVIFLAGSERKVTDNSRFLIHPPMNEVFGNADEIKIAMRELEKEQKKILDFYVAKTGGSSSEILALMKKDDWIDNDLVLSLNFATEIISTTATAALKENSRHKQLILKAKNMSTPKKSKMNASFINRVKALAKSVLDGSFTLVNKAFALEDGTEIHSESEEIVIDQALYLDAEFTEVLPDETYTLEDGTVIAVEGGVVVGVIAPNADEVTIETLQEEIVALKAELKTNKATIASAETAMNEAEEALKHVASTYKPQARAGGFSKGAVKKTSEMDIKSKMEAKRKEFQDRKKK